MTMNDKRHDLMTISVFASNTWLSVKALRLYDQLDILKPTYIDPDSGYRYYHIEQVHTARLIRMMRLMDMPLALIREVLEVQPDAAETLIKDYWKDMQQRWVLAGQVVHTLIHTIKGEAVTMPLEVEVKTVETQYIISMTHHVKIDKLDTTISDSVKKLREVAKENSAEAGIPFGLYSGKIDHETDGPIEVCLPTETLLTGTDDMQARELSGGKRAYVHLHDKECFFPHVLKGYDALLDWMRQNGYEHVGPPQEIWHSLDTDVEHIEIMWAFQEK